MKYHALILACLFAIAIGCDRKIDTQTAAYATSVTGGGNPTTGREKIMNYGCAACHIIPGIPDATSLIAPPLEHMANRTYVGGVVQNTPKNLIQWIQNPPAIDPKTAMPNLHVTLDDARDIASYLYTLK